MRRGEEVEEAVAVEVRDGDGVAAPVPDARPKP